MARLELRQRDAANRAAVLLGEDVRSAIVLALNFDQSLRQLERRLDRVVQATTILGPHDEAVDDHRDVVIHAPIEPGRIGDLDELAVDDRAYEALFARGLEQLAEFSFATAYERGKDLDLGALRPGENGVRDLA